MSYGIFLNDDGYRTTRLAAVAGTPAAPASACAAADCDELDALLSLARQCGMLVTLDGQIGREKYQSVAGSVTALQRFAAALRQSLAGDEAPRAAAVAAGGV